MKPLKRIEHFLGKIANDSAAKDLSPKTRYEHYLNEIAEEGGGGGGDSGSGGGANVLTLYADGSEAYSEGSATFTVYKNAELTEQYESSEEASNAIDGAGAIIIVSVGSSEGYTRLYPFDSYGNDGTVAVDVIIYGDAGLIGKSGILYDDFGGGLR